MKDKAKVKFLEEYLPEAYPDAVLIGDEKERKHYYPAIIGFDSNS